MSDNGDGRRAKFNVVEAQSFVLRAPDGTKRAVLGTAEDQASLTLLDGAEQQLISLNIKSDRPSIEFLDENGLVRLDVALAFDGSPSIDLTDGGPYGSFTVGISPDSGGANIFILDEEGVQRVGFSLENGTQMDFYDEKGKCVFSAPTKDHDHKST